jgi:hypothetical protein
MRISLNRRRAGFMLAVSALARLTATSQSALAAAPTPPVSPAVSAGLEDPGHLDLGAADLLETRTISTPQPGVTLIGLTDSARASSRPVSSGSVYSVRRSPNVCLKRKPRPRRLDAGAADLSAQVAHIHLDRVRARVEFEPPHAVEHLIGVRALAAGGVGTGPL